MKILKKNYSNGNANWIILVVVGIIVVAGLVWVRGKTQSIIGKGGPNASSTATTLNGTRLTFHGTFACLPYNSTSSGTPPPKNCALGLKANNYYYALDVTTVKAAATDLTAGSGIVLTGIFIPIQNIESSDLDLYNIRGVIHVESISKEN